MMWFKSQQVSNNIDYVWFLYIIIPIFILVLVYSKYDSSIYSLQKSKIKINNNNIANNMTSNAINSLDGNACGGSNGKCPVSMIKTSPAEYGRCINMDILNAKYENIVDDTLDYSNKPDGLFITP